MKNLYLQLLCVCVFISYICICLLCRLIWFAFFVAFCLLFVCSLFAFLRGCVFFLKSRCLLFCTFLNLFCSVTNAFERRWVNKNMCLCYEEVVANLRNMFCTAVATEKAKKMPIFMALSKSPHINHTTNTAKR